MKITIIGKFGFIGNYLIKNLKKKYIVTPINLRNINLKNIPKKMKDNIFSSNVIINCAASLNPKTPDDFYLNEKFTKNLLEINKHFKRTIIHLSTVNVLIKDRIDKYSISKKKAEISCKKYKNLFIIRLPLVFQRSNNGYRNIGPIGDIHSYLDKFGFFYCPFIYPGHLYRPIEIDEIRKQVTKIIKKKTKKKIINLKGEKKLNLFDIALDIARKKNIKIIKLDTRKFYNSLPNFLKRFVKKQCSVIQQLAPIDNTNFKIN